MNHNDQELTGLDLEDILKEFGESHADAEPSAAEETVREEVSVTEDTVRLDDLKPVIEETAVEAPDVTSDTVRLDSSETSDEASIEEPIAEEPATSPTAQEPELEILDFIPPAPIVFNPRSRLRELKRKLVAGPEKRYYELSEIGVGKLQMAMFLCLVVIGVSAAAAVMFALDKIPENRMRLMVFGQVLAMLMGALLGSYQMLDGIMSLLRGRFTAKTLLAFTFLACCADAVFCLKQLRVPICAAFTLEVMMSLWNEYHNRTTEMGMMDTMRKAVRLNSVVKCDDYFEGQSAIMQGEGQVEDFMDNYRQVTGPERAQNVYACIALVASLGIAIAAGILHGLSMGVQIFSTSLLVAMPASFFISLSRPLAVLERRLHTLGTVLCGWKGVLGLSSKCMYPLSDNDLFPGGSVKMNGVKFYGNRDPETIIAYAAALMHANGGTLAPIFDQLLNSRGGIRYSAENLQFYGNGGIGGEINGEPVLMGTLEFLKEMGVEIPEGVMVKQAVYVSVDGDLSGLFAVTYNRTRQTAAGMAAICSSRRIRPVVIARDFLLTPAFLKEKFGLRPRRTVFPSHAEGIVLADKKAAADAAALALTTQDGLASTACAITGARALRTACRLGVIIHIMGGVLGLLIMAALAVLGNTDLLTPLHILLYQLVWFIPGWIVTVWTRAV